MLHPEMLRAHVRIFDDSLRAAEREFAGAPEKLLANEALKRMLNALVGDLIRETARRVSDSGAPPSKTFAARPIGWWRFPRRSRSSAARPSNTLHHSLQQPGVAARSAGGGFGGKKSLRLLGQRSVTVTAKLPVPGEQPRRGPGGRRLYRRYDGSVHPAATLRMDEATGQLRRGPVLSQHVFGIVGYTGLFQ